MAPFPPRNEADESGESPRFPVPTPGGARPFEGERAQLAVVAARRRVRPARCSEQGALVRYSSAQRMAYSRSEKCAERERSGGGREETGTGRPNGASRRTRRSAGPRKKKERLTGIRPPS